VNGVTYFRADEGTVTERVVPTGGNTLVVGNLEAQWASPLLPQLLQLAAFADAGRLWNRGGTALRADGPVVKITPGLGIRVASPFGAVRIDFGYNAYALPAGAAYYNARPQGGVAPLYCVSPGNTLVVTTGGDPGVGDVVLVRSPDGWATASDTSVVRIIATSGQRVVCCDDTGSVTVDGVPLEESYASGASDQVAFDTVVPAGRIFVLVDDRATARDSRALLDVEGGTLSTDDVLGRVVLVAWPPRGPLG
jgi:signal peptidase I